jgi:hypothetical protein
MSSAWLIIGAVLGALGGKETAPEIAAEVVAWMIVTSVPGLLVGVIGGDAKGALIGAAGGLIGCLIAIRDPALDLQPLVMRFVVLVGALVGSTFLVYLHRLFWVYRMIFRTGYQFVSRHMAHTEEMAIADRSRSGHPFTIRWTRMRASLPHASTTPSHQVDDARR